MIKLPGQSYYQNGITLTFIEDFNDLSFVELEIHLNDTESGRFICNFIPIKSHYVDEFMATSENMEMKVYDLHRFEIAKHGWISIDTSDYFEDNVFEVAEFLHQKCVDHNEQHFSSITPKGFGLIKEIEVDPELVRNLLARILS